MSNKKRFLAIITLTVVALVCVIALVACTDTHECQSQCPICHKCTDKDCNEAACKDKCQGHDLQDYDMSGVTFENKTVSYNGEEQTLEVNGLPNGLNVSYEYYLVDGETETKLEGKPVNVGVYKVVAKFTGDDQHKAVEEMSATLTIEKANIEVVLGATQEVVDHKYKDLDKEVTFVKNDEGNFIHEYDGKEYAIEILSSNVDLDDIELEFYIDSDLETPDGGTIKNVGVTVYVLVTLDEYSENYDNYNPTALVSITIEKRTVEIATAADLELLRSEMSTVEGDIRYNTRYVLVDDINLEGAVWKTIGAQNERDSWIGEFDGNGKIISNFVINENSVEKDDILATNGTSFGFWGFLKDAYIHDVTFDGFNVSVDVKKLTENVPEYAFNGTAANPICFGILAGRTRFGSVIGTHFENVTVTNADIYLKTYGGFQGTFIGEEYAGAGGLDDQDDKNNGSDSAEGSRIIRKNLDATNVKIQASEYGSTFFGRLSIGGLVGELMFDTHYYEDCDLKEITLINGDETVHNDTFNGRDPSDRRAGYYTSNVGGLIGLDYSTWQESKFTNCNIENYTLISWVNNAGYAGIGDFYSGTMRGINGGDAFGSGVALVDCTAKNDDDAKYGLFIYNYDTVWNVYAFNADTETWTKYTFDSVSEEWAKQDGEYTINDDSGAWERK